MIVNPMAVGGSGGSNQPPPSECQTRYPADGYARQKTVIGMQIRKMIPARLRFRNATMEPARNTGPRSAPPRYEIQRSNQPGRSSLNGGHAIPKLTSAKKPTRKPSAVTNQLTISFRRGRIAVKGSFPRQRLPVIPILLFRHQ